jgi:hypothetical protein
MASVKKGVMVETIVRRDVDAESGWDWKLRDLPDTPETYYLQNLLAEHRFQEALKNYRDVRLMARTLDAWKTRLTALELTYDGRAQTDEDPEVLFKRAKEDWVEPWKHITIQLREEPALTAPSDSNTGLPDKTASPPIQLQLADAPDHFNGPLERMQDLRSRMGKLRDLTAVAGGEQSKVLEKLATEELESQKKTVEKYLVEARFALARLYDRELHKEQTPPPEPEDKGSLLQRFLHLFGGGKK